MDFPKVELVSDSDHKSDGLVLGFFSTEEKSKGKQEPGLYLGKRSSDVDSLIQRLAQSNHFFGKKGESDVLRFVGFGQWPTVLLIGLGAKTKLTLEGVRRAGASVYHLQKKSRLSHLTVQFDSFIPAEGSVAELPAVAAFCEGYFLASYQYREFKKSEKEIPLPKRLDLTGVKSSAKPAIKRAEILADAVCFARSLGDKPGNLLTPTELARLTSEMARSRKLKCTVMGKAQLQKEKMGLFLGVAKGSVEEPKLVVVDYRGGKKTDKPIALVGKGITFDSGGISIKPAPAMEEMKYDMMGAATVAGVMQAVSDLKLPLNVTGYIAAAENMPSGTAQKPGDIQTSSKGKTVEITNTDAEGRLVLADALEYAQRSEPQAIMDFATLTGAVVVALGSAATGVMGTSPELIQRIKSSSEATGEKVWELPLFEEYEEDLKSPYADLRNAGSRDAGSSKGGTFLKAFVDAKYPWVHFDIAGTAWNRKDLNYHPPKNASGVMVRLMAHLLENWSRLDK